MSPVLTRLAQRRQELGMSIPVLAKRSGVSIPTVQRILSGNNPNASLAIVESIAKALEVGLYCEDKGSSENVIENAAAKKARQLVSLTQGSAGLEAQAVSDDFLNTLRRRTVHKLVAGSRKKLWND